MGIIKVHPLINDFLIEHKNVFCNLKSILDNYKINAIDVVLDGMLFLYTGCSNDDDTIYEEVLIARCATNVVFGHVTKLHRVFKKTATIATFIDGEKLKLKETEMKIRSVQTKFKKSLATDTFSKNLQEEMPQI
jgi:hypothetical protein